MSELMTTTYSMWRLFRNCRMACKWRYIDELVPLERDPNLAFGSVIHDCLECWHGERDLARGTADPLADARIQQEIGTPRFGRPEGDWDLVLGELMTFANPGFDLPPIDRLEAFDPNGRCVYKRVLVAVKSQGGPFSCWTYHGPQSYSPRQCTPFRGALGRQEIRLNSVKSGKKT